MKKIVAIVTLAVSGAAFAGSVSVEGTSLNNIRGNDQTGASFTLNQDVNKTFSVHTQLVTRQTENTNAVSTRLEVGGTATTELVGSAKGYVKVALGEKYSSSGSFTYYSIEPGITMPVSSNVTARVGYRYRTAVNNPNVNNDTTDTVRVGLSYALSKNDSVGFRFDRITGDSRQDGYNVSYTRSF